jgi:hypothetical protein
MKQPILGRITEIWTDLLQRFSRYKSNFPVQSLLLGGSQFAGQTPRRNPCPPKDLVCHPVTDPGKSRLVQ